MKTDTASKKSHSWAIKGFLRGITIALVLGALTQSMLVPYGPGRILGMVLCLSLLMGIMGALMGSVSDVAEKDPNVARAVAKSICVKFSTLSLLAALVADIT